MQPAIWTEALSDLHQEVKGFFYWNYVYLLLDLHILYFVCSF